MNKNPLDLFQSLPGALSINAAFTPEGYKTAVFTDFNSAARFQAAFPDWFSDVEFTALITVETDPDWVPQGISTSPERLYNLLKRRGHGRLFDAAAKIVQFGQFNEAAVFKAVFPDWTVEFAFETRIQMIDEMDPEAAPYV